MRDLIVRLTNVETEDESRIVLRVEDDEAADDLMMALADVFEQGAPGQVVVGGNLAAEDE